MNSFTQVGLQSRQQPVSILSASIRRWALWRHRWHTRQQLSALTPAELADVGLSARQQREEGMKWFWR